MTLFLWHMTAYLIAILALWPLGFGREFDTTARWWLERPIWILVPGAILAAFVILVGRFERPPRRPTADRRFEPGPGAYAGGDGPDRTR